MDHDDTPLTLDEMFDCDPWDDDNVGHVTASCPTNAAGARFRGRHPGESLDAYEREARRHGYRF